MFHFYDLSTFYENIIKKIFFLRLMGKDNKKQATLLAVHFLFKEIIHYSIHAISHFP